jgi:hypothetical protein
MKLYDNCIARHKLLADAVRERELIEAERAARDAQEAKAVELAKPKRRWWQWWKLSTPVET